jgi:hypothetical protein
MEDQNEADEPPNVFLRLQQLNAALPNVQRINSAENPDFMFNHERVRATIETDAAYADFLKQFPPNPRLFRPHNKKNTLVFSDLTAFFQMKYDFNKDKPLKRDSRLLLEGFYDAVGFWKSPPIPLSHKLLIKISFIKNFEKNEPFKQQNINPQFCILSNLTSHFLLILMMKLISLQLAHHLMRLGYIFISMIFQS